ncbi:hypothetical protein [Endozoicomonas atrinae]|uniref:hypothetical protein n=1 Tax=Endozoicomonas atrinae TaxID=1333660 RepID=UPI003B00802A
MLYPGGEYVNVQVIPASGQIICLPQPIPPQTSWNGMPVANTGTATIGYIPPPGISYVPNTRQLMNPPPFQIQYPPVQVAEHCTSFLQTVSPPEGISGKGFDPDDSEIKYPPGMDAENQGDCGGSAKLVPGLNPLAPEFKPAPFGAETNSTDIEIRSATGVVASESKAQEKCKGLPHSADNDLANSISVAGVATENALSSVDKTNSVTLEVTGTKPLEPPLSLDMRAVGKSKSALPELSELLVLGADDEPGAQASIEERKGNELIESESQQVKVKKKKRNRRKVKQSGSESQQGGSLREGVICGVQARNVKEPAFQARVEPKEKQVTILRRKDSVHKTLECSAPAAEGADIKGKGKKRRGGKDDSIMPEHFEILADDFRKGNLSQCCEQFKAVIDLMDRRGQGRTIRVSHLHLLTCVYIRLDAGGCFSSLNSSGKNKEWCIGEEVNRFKERSAEVILTGLRCRLNEASKKDSIFLAEVFSMIVKERSRGFDLSTLGDGLSKLLFFLDQAPFTLWSEMAPDIASYNDIGFELKEKLIAGFYKDFLNRLETESSGIFKNNTAIINAFKFFMKAYCFLQNRCSLAGVPERWNKYKKMIFEIFHEKNRCVKEHQSLLDKKIEEKQKDLDELKLKQEAELAMSPDKDGLEMTGREGEEVDKVKEDKYPLPVCPATAQVAIKKESDEARFDTAMALLRKGDSDQAMALFKEICSQKNRSLFYYYSRVELIKIPLKSSWYLSLLDTTKELSAMSKKYYWDYRYGREDMRYTIQTSPEELEKLSADVSKLCNDLAVQLSAPIMDQLYVLDELMAKSIELKDTGEELLTDEFQIQMQDVQKETSKMKWLLESAGLANVSTQEAFRFRSLWLKSLPKKPSGRPQGANANNRKHFVESPQQCLSKLEEEAEKVEALLSRHGCIAKMASALVGG